MKKHAAQQPDRSDIDLTPMLDVVFILLIFFIVTASFLKEQSIFLSPSPQHTDRLENQGNAIVFAINRNNEISLENRRVDIRVVRSIISQRVAANDDAQIAVNAHEAAAVESYVAILNAARQESIYTVPLTLVR